MTSLRRHIHRCRCLAVALVVAALFVKMLVPMGYMPSFANGAFVIQPCDGRNAGSAMMQTAIAADDHAHADQHDHRGHGEKHDEKPNTFDKPCAFSGLATPLLAGADPIVLAIAIAFILAAIFRVEQRLVLRRAIYLRPPSQGPPATA